jgi:Flp pilus assembly protein TadD
VKKISVIFVLITLLGLCLAGQLFAGDPLGEGKAAFERKDYQSAISSFLEAVRKDKKNPEPYMWLSRTLK